jgi:large subunit ribosomal protein L13
MEMSEKKGKTTKTLSRGTAKKVSKAAQSAKKITAKTIVRTSRTTIRAEKAQTPRKTGKSPNARLKTKLPGHSPQSSRISAPRGEITPIRSRTRFLSEDAADRKWLLVDATGQTVGRLASQIAVLLRGKHKANFTPNNDTGDFVVVINAEKVVFTGNKEGQKKYHWHSQYIGGIKTTTPERLRRTYPDRILRSAVKGMITRNPLGRDQMKKLKIYSGEQHPHAAQLPVVWKPRYDSTVDTKATASKENKA